MQIKDLIPWARQDEGNRTGSADQQHPVAELQRQMNQAFENFWGGDRPFAAGGWPFGEEAPRSDVVETDNGIEVTVELPGMQQSDIEVSLSGDTLTVKGEKRVERKDEKKGYYVSERSYGSVMRSIPLPPGVDAEKADAAFKNGVLTVKIPHAPEAKSKMKKIAIRSD